MTITATIIADSISQEQKRITTFMLRYPRFIHAEFMTHRVFSRNASSSRAIPVKKMIEDLRRDPAMPIFWGSNKPGMQAGDELYGADLNWVKRQWLGEMEDAIGRAEQMMSAGLHKQIANRILEPWAHINVVCTATEWANWFALRNHPMAQPEIKMLAEEMLFAMAQSKPNLLLPGEWHLPFINAQDWSEARIRAKTGRITRDEPMYDELVEDLKKVSTARCARTSYLTHDGRKTTIKEDLELFQKLVVDTPLHASPAEHQATPDEKDEHGNWTNPYLHGNFSGFIQYRKTLPDEYVEG